ncbi:hypothetical protein RHCRD62_40098 [Rhodococcus sp. RD6.2]|nr:hypothetical protein RHCRD62_40098 [Rhodococcus sp. RD6.2]
MTMPRTAPVSDPVPASGVVASAISASIALPRRVGRLSGRRIARLDPPSQFVLFSLLVRNGYASNNFGHSTP